MYRIVCTFFNLHLLKSCKFEITNTHLNLIYVNRFAQQNHIEEQIVTYFISEPR